MINAISKRGKNYILWIVKELVRTRVDNIGNLIMIHINVNSIKAKDKISISENIPNRMLKEQKIPTIFANKYIN